MKTLDIPIPANREEAIEAIAALDAARWGEDERATSRKVHGGKSYGLLLNSLAHRSEYGYGDDVPHLVEAADRAMTSADRKLLYDGG